MEKLSLRSHPKASETIQNNLMQTREANSMIDTNLPPALQLFPHQELRNYQTKFLRFVEKNPKAMIHAPVGFGKTIMTLIHTLPLVTR